MPPQLKIQALRFRAGAVAGAAPLSIEVPTVTILVGPNNSGKSLALREIENWCWNLNENRTVVDEIRLHYPNDPAEAVSMVETYKSQPPQGQVTSPDHVWVGLPTFRSETQVLHEQLSLQSIRQAVAGNSPEWLRHGLARLFTIRLDGRTRFTLSDAKPSGDLQAHPQNHLWALFSNGAARDRVRQFTEEAFGLHFTIDPTGMTRFRVRMSRRKPASKQEEQALDETSRRFHSEAELISNLSDGVQTYTGLVSAVLSLPHQILLIDEPEAFLHPPLARRLGHDLAQIATERDASMIVATHSSEFLMGCIEATPGLRIVRFTFEGNVATARSIEPASLAQLMMDPLLRSAQALRGLFHRCVVISEADKDRAFYEEVNFRFLNAGRGISDVLFLNAQNWQTIPQIAAPLRRLGVPTAAIMDLDVVANPNKWGEIFDMLNVAAAERAALEAQRQRCEAHLVTLPDTADGRRPYKLSGLNSLDPVSRAEVQAFITSLRVYGLFIVDVGEVECWMSYLGVPHDPKKTWLTRVFDAMGSDPNLATYARPRDDDVWSFVNEIRAWIENPVRQGIPA